MFLLKRYVLHLFCCCFTKKNWDIDFCVSRVEHIEISGVDLRRSRIFYDDHAKFQDFLGPKLKHDIFCWLKS